MVDLQYQAPGTIWWFEHDQGLNGYGLIPGTNLKEQHVSKDKYNDFWRVKNYYNGTRYKTMVSAQRWYGVSATSFNECSSAQFQPRMSFHFSSGEDYWQSDISERGWGMSNGRRTRFVIIQGTWRVVKMIGRSTSKSSPTLMAATQCTFSNQSTLNHRRNSTSLSQYDDYLIAVCYELLL